MQPELLLFDIGNTCIKVGLADSRGVMTSYNLRTDPAQTSDSLGLTLLELLRHAGAEPRFTACVASSVVPGFDPLLREAVQRYLGCPLWMVPQDMPIPLQNHYERPQEVGADRLVGARTPAAERVEFHAMSMEGDVMRMTPLGKGIEIPPGETVEARPGGLHLQGLLPHRPEAAAAGAGYPEHREVSQGDRHLPGGVPHDLCTVLSGAHLFRGSLYAL